MAIAFDVVNHNFGNPTSSVTISHTVANSGSADVLFVIGGMTDNVTGATDNGTSMTLLDKSILGTGSRWCYTFALSGVASGTSNVIISAVAGDLVSGVVMTYSGVGSIGNHTLLTGASATTFSTNLSTVNANEVIVAVGQSDNQVVSGTWSQNTRYSDGVIWNGNFGDKSFASSGSQSMSYSQSPGAPWIIQAVALRPVAASTSLPFKSLLGVGI